MGKRFATLACLLLKVASSHFFVLVFTIDGFLTPGYSAMRDVVSFLELGPTGWIQSFNFILTGLVIVPGGQLWKRFGPLHVYAPASEYILALKITAGCQKDLDDCAILLLSRKTSTG